MQKIHKILGVRNLPLYDHFGTKVALLAETLSNRIEQSGGDNQMAKNDNKNLSLHATCSCHQQLLQFERGPRF